MKNTNLASLKVKILLMQYLPRGNEKVCDWNNPVCIYLILQIMVVMLVLQKQWQKMKMTIGC